MLSKIDLVGDPARAGRAAAARSRPSIAAVDGHRRRARRAARARAAARDRGVARQLGRRQVVAAERAGRRSRAADPADRRRRSRPPHDDAPRAVRRRRRLAVDRHARHARARAAGRATTERGDDRRRRPFDDIAELAASCRFRDCKHAPSPAARSSAAVATGELERSGSPAFTSSTTEHQVAVADQKTARRIAETRKAKAKRYAPRPGKPEDER